MKKNNKGFLLTEAFIASTFIVTVLTFLYIQFRDISRGYEQTFKYNTINALYGVNNVRNLLYEEGLTTIKTAKGSALYLDITNCDIIVDVYNEEFCELLFNNINAKTVLFTDSDITALLTSDLSIFSEELQDYIRALNYDRNTTTYRLIVEYNDNTFGSLVLREE